VAGDEIETASDLYGVEPAGFIAARAALVKRLKAAGEKEAAADVGALRKPSAGAWALNQVARTDPSLVEAALEAGASLRAATDAAVGGDASQLRAATAADRAATEALVDAAAEQLGSKGPAAKHSLAATVRAAVLDDDVAVELRAGTLTVEHDGSGFGFGSGFEGGEVIPFRPREKAKPKARAKAGATDGGEAAAATAAREAEAAAAREAAEAAEAAEAEERERAARRRRAELEEKVKKLERRAARLAEVAEKAEEAAREAREDADEAASAVVEARVELADAGG
jgi:hypothetical protein